MSRKIEIRGELHISVMKVMSEGFKPLLELKTEDERVLCPQCGDRFMHILKTTTTLGDLDEFHLDIVKPVEAGKKETSKIELVHEQTIRGGRDYNIDLYYECESGCKGIIRFNHHEGDIYLLHKPTKT